MARIRINTTVDADLLNVARQAHDGSTDAELIDAALSALLAVYRRTEIDNAYKAAEGAQPIDEPDEWGDLASFRSFASQA